MAVDTVTPLHHNDPHWEDRVDLACLFRWTARLGMHEGIANHYSLVVNDDGSQFLMNPKGRHFSRIRASDLLLLDANDPTCMDRPDAPERTAWALHGALHRRNPKARCALHVHSTYATALSTLADPTLPPIDQNTMRFFERVAVDDGYDGMGVGDEAERVCQQFADKSILIMGNHGVMLHGPSAAWAFDELYYFEKAAQTYLIALSSGQALSRVSDAVARKTAAQWLEIPEAADEHLAELKAILDDEEPDYRT
ncbi:MAG: class II aldolase and adducin N-terminal domain-containing protein [Pseudomonadota bacterium]